MVLGISTPLEAGNFYSQLLEAKKPDGRPLFNVLEVTTLCDACLAAGKLECPHKTELPSWKTSERQDLVKALMAGRDANMFRREACGVVTRSNTECFNAAYLLRASAPDAAQPMRDLGAPAHLFVCIDPCGGGASSLAIVSGVFQANGGLVLVGADAFAVSNDEDQEKALHLHMSRLRDVPTLAASRIILVIERNYGGGVLASRIAALCAPFGQVAAMTQDTNPKLMRVGVVTTHQVKERMRIEFARLLRCDALRFSTPFVSASADGPQKLCEQLRNYRMEMKEGTELTGPKFFYTGKGFGKSDDLAIAAQMHAYWPSTFYAEGDRCLVR